jgi:hypothetical protein
MSEECIVKLSWEIAEQHCQHFSYKGHQESGKIYYLWRPEMLGFFARILCPTR